MRYIHDELVQFDRGAHVQLALKPSDVQHDSNGTSCPLRFLHVPAPPVVFTLTPIQLYSSLTWHAAGPSLTSLCLVERDIT